MTSRYRAGRYRAAQPRSLWVVRPAVIAMALVAAFLQGVAAQGLKPLSEAQTTALKATFERPRTTPLPGDVPFPSDAAYSPAVAKLGRALFFDTRLSAANDQSCASCHSPDHGWEAPVARVVGRRGTPLERHVPTLVNVAFVERLLRDGAAANLEEQALGPIGDPDELASSIGEIVGRLSSDTTMRNAFRQAFGSDVTGEGLLIALATFQRTIVAPDTAFDRWVRGDASALSAAARRGFELFNTRARCAACHAGWNFTDGRFHDIGLRTADIGRAAIEPGRLHAFRTPTLRQIGLRAPYMHDGSIGSLEAVVRHYEQGGMDRPSRSPLLAPFQLTEAERGDLLSFLDTLTGD